MYITAITQAFFSKSALKEKHVFVKHPAPSRVIWSHKAKVKVIRSSALMSPESA